MLLFLLGGNGFLRFSALEGANYESQQMLMQIISMNLLFQLPIQQIT